MHQQQLPLLFCLLLVLFSCHACGLQISLRERTGASVLPIAAQQLRRYLHELDRRIAPIRIVAQPTNDDITLHLAIAAESCPHGTSYIVSRPSVLNISLLACDEMGQGSLFAVTDLLTSMGLYFSAEGPPFLPVSARDHAIEALILSNQSNTAWIESLTERVLVAASTMRTAATPVFAYRGFQPWGSYPIGNDWWDRDEYRRVVEQIVGLKGNWIGMHSYPCSYSYPEPGVWIDPIGGESADILPNGNLTPAAGGPLQCAASWAATNRPSWGLRALNTSSLKFGASQLFERDCFTNRELTAVGICGVPIDGASNVAAHNAVANLYKNVFSFAARLGVSTALGAEMPVPVASATPLQLRTYWSVGRLDMFVTPTLCAECPPPSDKDAYDLLSISDAYLLPVSGDGLLALDCYWDESGTDAWLGVFNVTSPPSSGAYGFVRREGYAFALPNASPSAPTVPLFQYVRTNFSKPGGVDTWLVVGDAGAAAAEARGYTAFGGSRIPVAYALTTPPTPPTSDALAAYTDAFTRLERLYGNNLTWYWSWSKEEWQWGKVKQTSPDVIASVLQIPIMEEAARNVNASFEIALGGWTLGPYDNKTLFDFVAPSEWPMGALDGYLGTNSPEIEFGNLSDSRPRWSFPWSEDDNDLTAIQMWVGRNLDHAAAALAMGVSGHASLQWRTRTVSPALTAVADFPWNTSLTSNDFLSAYADAAFGGGPASDALGTILRSVDSLSMPRPVHCDPGCMKADTSFCSASGEAPYAFIDDWLAQRAAVLTGGDPNALERFDYWAAHFFQLRAMARAQCAWGNYETALREVKAAPSGSPQQHSLAISLGFPAFSNMVSNFSQLVWALQGAMASYGDLGVLFQLYGDVNDAAGDDALAVLEGLAGGALCGTPCALPKNYTPTLGSPVPRLRALTVRTILERGEPLNIRLHAIGDSSCGGAGTVCTAYVRVTGDNTYTNVTLPQEGVGRAVFYANVPIPDGAEEAGLDWYASTVCEGSVEALMFPPGAPSQPQTIIFI
jgi:hypothetical protein